MYKKQETKIKKKENRVETNVGSFATRVRLRNAVKQRRKIMNQRESLNIQNQSIEGAVTCGMSNRKATQREKKGRERKNQIEKGETKIKNKCVESRNMNLGRKRA